MSLLRKLSRIALATLLAVGMVSEQQMGSMKANPSLLKTTSIRLVEPDTHGNDIDFLVLQNPFVEALFV